MITSIITKNTRRSAVRSEQLKGDLGKLATQLNQYSKLLELISCLSLLIVSSSDGQCPHRAWCVVLLLFAVWAVIRLRSLRSPNLPVVDRRNLFRIILPTSPKHTPDNHSPSSIPLSRITSRTVRRSRSAMIPSIPVAISLTLLYFPNSATWDRRIPAALVRVSFCGMVSSC